jgi:hypothetical protein
MQKTFAPVLIPTLCRFSHLKRCIESLLSNTIAKQTPLYIALDYPFKESHWEGYYLILNFISNLSGFSEVEIIRRDSNYGPGKNILEALDIVFCKSNTVILSEDDNEFSPNFLSYINKGLDIFENKKEVFAICGYNYPIKIQGDRGYYFTKAFSAWGYGIWKDRKLEYLKKRNIRYIKSVLNNFKNIQNINKYADHYLPHALHMVESGSLTGDTIISLDLILQNKFCVFPTVSKVRNHGYDGSGIHCGVDTAFAYQNIDDSYFFDFFETNIFEKKEINNKIKEYFKISISSKIKIYLKYILYRMGCLKFVLSLRQKFILGLLSK